jgi:hypothetical protein
MRKIRGNAVKELSDASERTNMETPNKRNPEPNLVEAGGEHGINRKHHDLNSDLSIWRVTSCSWFFPVAEGHQLI